MDGRKGRTLHDNIGFIGLRAQATAVGLIQLTLELARAGVLDEAAFDRIKSAIACDLALRPPPHVTSVAFESQIRNRLDELFSREALSTDR